MTIALGADAFGFELKDTIKEHLHARKIAVLDLTPAKETDVPYYDAAAQVARAIQRGDADRGLLFCGTGMGVAIVANKFKGVYAGVVESEFSGEHCKCINNANVLTMGAMAVAPYRAKRIVDTWLGSEFTGGFAEFSGFLRDALEKIQAIEQSTMK